MKFLHTADWHVGKTLKGRPRLDEQREVLSEIVGLARTHDVDAVLIAGDVYDSAAPTADAQRLVVQVLLALARDGIKVLAIAGNHDHGRTFEAYRPLMEVAGIELFGQVRPRDKGGVHTFTARSDGASVNVGMLPFLSQRDAVRGAQLIAPGDNVPARNSGAYEQWVRNFVTHLGEGYDPDGVNLMMAHLTTIGGVQGGGERSAQTIFEYSVAPTIFPTDSHYVALGHLHRRQEVASHCPVHYSGAPLRVDFGEEDYTPSVLLVEAEPGRPARVTDLELTSPRRLRTVEGSVEELRSRSEELSEEWLRVRVTQTTYAGLRDDILEALPNALEIHVQPDPDQLTRTRVSQAQVAQVTPRELFASYSAEVGSQDERVTALFDELHDETTGHQPSTATPAGGTA